MCKDEYNVKIAECYASMESRCSNLCQHFDNLLGSELIPELQEIVPKETTTDGYIAKGGVRMQGMRGHSNDALEAYIRKWSLLVMQPNAAKRHCMYMQV